MSLIIAVEEPCPIDFSQIQTPTRFQARRNVVITPESDNAAVSIDVAMCFILGPSTATNNDQLPEPKATHVHLRLRSYWDGSVCD